MTTILRFSCLALATALTACTLDSADYGAGTTSDTGAEPTESSGGQTTASPGESTTGSEGTTGGPPAESSGAGDTTSAGSVSSEGGGSDSGSGDGAESSTGAVEPSPECMVYCTEFLENCQTIPGVETYDDEADCFATCAGFAHGESGTFVGDTVECRVDHLTFDPTPDEGYYELHCFHSQEHPASQCL